jgi:hypothetical protein
MRAVACTLAGAAIAGFAGPGVIGLAAFSSATSSPANTFTSLEVEPALLDPASQSGGTIQLTWSASPTAASESVTYDVMRRSGGGSFARVASVGGLSYDDDPGDGTWEYVVRSVVSTFSTDSNARSATVDQTPPTAATGVTAAPGGANGTVALSWTAATDATSGVAGYTIRHVQASSCPADPTAYPSATSVGAVTSTTVSGLTRNKQYCFYLVTTDGAGNQSGPSDVASAKAK